MTEDLIRYDILAQEALRGVVRKVLYEVSQTGLPDNHHFFITFLTQAQGVRISSALAERYPEKMTIVLQYQFWDLKVTDTGFSITLSFADKPEKLEVPFAAICGFFDPSVNFELEFDVQDEMLITSDPQDASVEVLPVETASEADDANESQSADVVSLDSFRQKK